MTDADGWRTRRVFSRLVAAVERVGQGAPLPVREEKEAGEEIADVGSAVAARQEHERLLVTAVLAVPVQVALSASVRRPAWAVRPCGAVQSADVGLRQRCEHSDPHARVNGSPPTGG